MKKQAIHLFIFSFICFIAVFISGSLLSSIKKSITDTDVLKNISLFHNHFDQLCWLGSAAIGCVFYALDNRFKRSMTVLKIFTFSYIIGTLFFSFGFLFRAIGIYYNNMILEKSVAIGMISLGGVFIIVATLCAIYIALSFIFYKDRNENNTLTT